MFWSMLPFLPLDFFRSDLNRPFPQVDRWPPVKGEGFYLLSPHRESLNSTHGLCVSTPLPSSDSPGQRKPSRGRVKVMTTNAPRHEFQLPRKNRDPPTWTQGFTQRTLKKSPCLLAKWPQVPPISAWASLPFPPTRSLFPFPRPGLGYVTCVDKFTSKHDPGRGLKSTCTLEFGNSCCSRFRWPLWK